MFKKDKYRKMVPEFVEYMNRYTEEYLHEPADTMQKKAEEIYKKMYEETPQIGGGANPMADNLYDYMTFCAYYEASEHRIGTDAVPIISKWMLEKKKFLGKIINLNRKSSVNLMNCLFRMVADTTAKKTAKGEWGNTWRIECDSKKHDEGVYFTLSSCPLLAFAKAHGYEKTLPSFCVVDHDSAALMHGRLIRFSTEASGGEHCDYWMVGDKSESAGKYGDLPKK